jgi:hypothetical protein
MHRRSLLATGGSLGLLALAGCVERAVPGHIETTGATGAIHAVDQPFLDGGASYLDGLGYVAALFRSETDVDQRWLGPDDDPVTDRVRRTDWDREFILVVEARTRRDQPLAVEPMPGTARQTSLSGMRCDGRLEPWTGDLPADAGDEVVFTLAITLEREGIVAPKPKQARVDLHAPEGEPEGTVTVRTG